MASRLKIESLSKRSTDGRGFAETATVPASSQGFDLDLGNLLTYAAENGLYLMVRRAAERMRTIIFSWCVAHKLANPAGLSIHYTARMRGLKHMEIGQNFSSGRMLWLEAIVSHGSRTYTPKIVIKNDVAVNDFVHIAATRYVEIGDGVLIASHVFIADHNHGNYSASEQSSPLNAPNLRPVSDTDTVVIEDNVWIGDGVAILGGAHIGRGSIIGANSVVKGQVAPFSIAVGSPARVIKQFDFDVGKWKSCLHDQRESDEFQSN